MRGVRRVFPVTGDFHGGKLVRAHRRRGATRRRCSSAWRRSSRADIAFAVDSIPAAFAITRDSVLIWMGNVFALLGMRALFVLVEGLIRRFRYLDETIAVVLALVGGQAADRGPLQGRPASASLGIVAVVLRGRDRRVA